MRRITILAAAIVLESAVCLAGIRAPGKYDGVVIFDRWDGCTLYSGIYLMYVSESVKEQLRPDAGECVQIDATQVEQPMNPGDGLIKKFTILDPPPAKPGESPGELKITSAPAFEDGQMPEVVIRAQNVGDKPFTLRLDSLAPTLLVRRSKDGQWWSPSDGPSVAAVTRQSFWIGTDGPRMTGANPAWHWEVVAPRRLEENEVVLEPKAVFEIRLSFKLPAGEYDFLAGYGRCMASNLVGFDVEKGGTATLVNLPR